jgi:hypothetical protein
MSCCNVVADYLLKLQFSHILCHKESENNECDSRRRGDRGPLLPVPVPVRFLLCEDSLPSKTLVIDQHFDSVSKLLIDANETRYAGNKRNSVRI